jgi:hypothetical protein
MNKLLNGVIILIAIIIILLVVIIFAFFIFYREHKYYTKYEYARNLKSMLLSENYHNLKSGDIILYKANAVQLEHVIFTHSFFTHTGMIIKYNNKLYITESNPPNEEYVPANTDKLYTLNPVKKYIIGKKIKSGASIIPLFDRIKYFPGDCYLMSLNKPLSKEKESELLYWVFDSGKKISYPKYKQLFTIFLKEKIGFRKSTTIQHCFEYIAYLLDRLKITNNIHTYDLINICNKISQLWKKKLNNGYIYEPPVKII